MTLSNSVEYSLREAQAAHRNALAFSARSEKPFVSKHIADMLSNIENLCDISEILDKAEEARGLTD